MTYRYKYISQPPITSLSWHTRLTTNLKPLNQRTWKITLLSRARVTVKVIYYLRRQLCNCRGVGDRPLSHIHTRHKEHRTRHAGRLRSADLLTFTQRNSLSRLFLQNVPSLLSAIEHRKLSKQVLAKSSICTALISVRYSPLMNWTLLNYSRLMNAGHTVFIDHFDRLLKHKFKKTHADKTAIVTQKVN